MRHRGEKDEFADRREIYDDDVDEKTVVVTNKTIRENGQADP